MQGTGLRKLLLSPLGFDHPALAIAASRAGGTGVLDLELSRAPALAQLQLLARQAGKQGFGVRLGGFDGELAEQLIQLLDAGLNLLILGREHWAEWQGWLSGAALTETTLLLELSDNDPLDSAIAHRVDGLLLKGHEAAGFVGESSAFILVQHWRATCDLPLYLRGGITPHTAAAAALAGCAGVVLDSQVVLLQESPLATELQTHLRSLSGSETVAAGNGEFGRYLSHPLASRLRQGQGLYRRCRIPDIRADARAPAGRGGVAQSRLPACCRWGRTWPSPPPGRSSTAASPSCSRPSMRPCSTTRSSP